MEAVHSFYRLEVQATRILRGLVGALDIWRHKVEQETKQRDEDLLRSAEKSTQIQEESTWIRSSRLGSLKESASI